MQEAVAAAAGAGRPAQRAPSSHACARWRAAGLCLCVPILTVTAAQPTREQDTLAPAHLDGDGVGRRTDAASTADDLASRLTPQEAGLVGASPL